MVLAGKKVIWIKNVLYSPLAVYLDENNKDVP